VDTRCSMGALFREGVWVCRRFQGASHSTTSEKGGRGFLWKGEDPLSFLGDYRDRKPTEVTLERALLIHYVRQLFRRWDFPTEMFVALADSTVSSVGDLVWANSDCEHPFDWIPLPRIDDLVVNLPSKEQFVRTLGFRSMEDVPPEVEARFWDSFDFAFGERAGGVRLIWV